MLQRPMNVVSSQKHFRGALTKSKEIISTDLLHLIADVKLGRIEEQKYEIAACRKPPADLNEVVRTLHTHECVRPR